MADAEKKLLRAQRIWGGNSPPSVAARLRKPAAGSFSAEMDGALAPSIFSFSKEKQKKENEITNNGNIPSGSEGGQPGRRTLHRGCFRLSELVPLV